jgi:pimeloyl-ACP methyl ester carboxylesterase
MVSGARAPAPDRPEEDPMPTVTIEGIELAYEVIGEQGGGWIITPGGRFSKDTPGVRELAQVIAEQGNRVVIWDRPNTGESSVSFRGPTESEMQADALAGLLRALDLAPATIVGGSGGARVSLLAAANHPDVATRLAILWITGGVYGLMNLGIVYCAASISAAWRRGMEAVAELPDWAEVIERNPANRDRILALDRDEFITTMERWMHAYCPGEGRTVPGITDDRLRDFRKPALILRSGVSDAEHTRATSERLHELIPGSQLAEPPWGDREWTERMEAVNNGTAPGLFVRWPLLAPMLLDFAGRNG